eukprot:1261486-Amphidinium_carterae.1
MPSRNTSRTLSGSSCGSKRTTLPSVLPLLSCASGSAGKPSADSYHFSCTSPVHGVSATRKRILNKQSNV